MKPKLDFSKKDTAIIKGFAIMLIVLHNYLHWQDGFGIENESDFLQQNVYIFFKNLYPLQWTETVSAVFGFLGHYGVQLFIFISAYGLTAQRMNISSFDYRSYLFRRLKKLYFLLLFGVVVYQILFTIHFGEIYSLKNTIIKIGLLATSVSNFSDTYLYKMISGPFWFFGLMVQLYIAFPVLYKIVKKYNIYLIYATTFLLIYLLYYLDRHSEFNLFGTVFGHLPEIFLGIYFSQNQKTKPSLLLFIISIFIFAASQFYWFVFPFGFAAITIIFLYLIESLKPCLNAFWTQVLLYIGKISMILFVVNGVFREFSLFSIKDMQLRGERVFLFLLLLFIFCHFAYKVYNYLYKKLKI